MACETEVGGNLVLLPAGVIYYVGEEVAPLMVIDVRHGRYDEIFGNMMSVAPYIVKGC